jgi:hypothetical protein
MIMARKRTPLTERKRLFAEIEGRRAKGLTVAAACKEVGVKTFNYATWKRKFGSVAGASATAPVAGKNSSASALSFRVDGSSDLMFIGFGKSREVLQAISGIASIFEGRV